MTKRKSKTNKERLQDDSLKASRIEQLMSQPGWEIVKDIIQRKYESLMDVLLEKENPEARGGINTINEIMSDISRDLQFGRSARDKYASQYLNLQKPDGE